MVSVEEENSVSKVQFGFLLTSSGAPPVVITWRGAQWRMWHSRLLSEQMFLQTRNVLKLYISLGSVLCFISWQSCAQLRLALGTKTMWRMFGKILCTRLKNVFWSPHTRLKTSWDLLKNTQLVSTKHGWKLYKSPLWISSGVNNTSIVTSATHPTNPVFWGYKCTNVDTQSWTAVIGLAAL